MGAATGWFCTLLETTPEIYFRYALVPAGRLVYVSPAIADLTGREAGEFCRNPGLCGALVARGEGRLLRRILRARRTVSVTVHVVREGVALPVDVRAVPVVKRGRTVAIEGVARLAVVAERDRPVAPALGTEPVQQRLAALMVEVHGLLHRVLPPAAAVAAPATLRLGDLAFDPERMTVTESGRSVSLTARELLVLRYLLERLGRIVTRDQLLVDVWDYSYTGDARTVDVHVSRLRRKLPSLRGRLTAIRHIGYRLDTDIETPRAANA